MNDRIRVNPFSMAQMQNLLLLSKFIVQKNTPFRLWKLHETIEHRLPTGPPHLPTKSSKKEPQPEDEPEDTTDVQQVEEEVPLEQSTTRDTTIRFLPANTSRPWSTEELSFINLDRGVKTKLAYQQYLRACEEKRFPPRCMITK